MTNDSWTPQFHLFPPQGWMNDPNGLCQFKSVYHAFYQYTPEWPANELRFWGHAVSKDLLSWETLPIAISPDAAFDKDGVFSGSAWIEARNAAGGCGHDSVAAGDCGHGGVVAAGDGTTTPAAVQRPARSCDSSTPATLWTKHTQKPTALTSVERPMRSW